MQDSYKLVKRDGRFYVAWTGARYNEPVIFTRYYPVSVDRSQGAMAGDEELDLPLRAGDLCLGGSGSLYYFQTLQLKPGQVSAACERRLEKAVIVAVDSDEHSAAMFETRPYPAPKTKLQTRYHKGRWEKLLKRGWVPV
jgi:hypothetical protein